MSKRKSASVLVMQNLKQEHDNVNHFSWGQIQWCENLPCDISVIFLLFAGVENEES